VEDVDKADRTGLPNIDDISSKRCQALFGHVVRLEATTVHTKCYAMSLQSKAVIVWE